MTILAKMGKLNQGISTLCFRVLILIDPYQEVKKLVRPLGARVLVKPEEEEEKTSGGIVLPDTAKKRPQVGTVVAVGPGRLLDNGQYASLSVKVGDKVVYSRYSGNEIKIDGEDYILLEEDSLYAIKE